MEEDNIELIDYLRVIWKRKILICVGTLVCSVVIGVVAITRPVVTTYRANALLRIGKAARLNNFNSFPNFSEIEDSATMARALPTKYKTDSKYNGYHLETEMWVSTPSMIRVILNGPDTRTEELLKDIVNRIIADHHEILNVSVAPYKTLADKLESEAKDVQAQIELAEARVDADAKVVQSIIDLTKTRIEEGKSVGGGGESYLEIILSNKKTSEADYLRKSNDALRTIQREQLMYRTIIDNLNDYDTEIIGGVVSYPVIQKKSRKAILAGLAGFAGFILLAFFMEYLEKVRTRSKNSV